ncbi:hypothetical protein N7490_010805 [Penicillium lividum]|nr:hypothetical protein N7490_010805 [Penicillium lividum]
MNGHSEPLMESQVSQMHSSFEDCSAPDLICETKQKARQLRRQRRRQARLGSTEVTEESSDEVSHIGSDRRAAREPIERLVAVLNFLGSYNNEVDQIERALGNLLQKDERIQSLSATVKELQHFKNEESRMLEEKQRRLEELQSQLNDEKISLENLRQTLDQKSRQLEDEKRQFKTDETARYDKAMAAEKNKLKDELQKRIKQNEKTMAAKFEQAEQEIQGLQNQVSAHKLAKDNTERTLDDTERTLGLFKDRTKELEGQKKELESKFKTQDSPFSEL